MAISVSFGLFATTVGLLVLLPAMIIMVNRFKFFATRMWMNVRPAYKDLEAATPNSTIYNWPLYAIATVILLVTVSVGVGLLKMVGTAIGGG